MSESISNDVIERAKGVLEKQGDVLVVVVFGSVAKGGTRPASDLDIGVAGRSPLTANRRLELMDELAVAVGRPIDLVDLATAPFPVLGQALTKGKCVIKSDSTVYASLIRKLWYDNADIRPNYDYVLRYRQKRFAEPNRVADG